MRDSILWISCQMAVPAVAGNWNRSIRSHRNRKTSKRLVEEMARVLKPGGRVVIATWCQREEGERHDKDRSRRQPLGDEEARACKVEGEQARQVEDVRDRAHKRHLQVGGLVDAALQDRRRLGAVAHARQLGQHDGRCESTQSNNVQLARWARCAGRGWARGGEWRPAHSHAAAAPYRIRAIGRPHQYASATCVTVSPSHLG